MALSETEQPHFALEDVTAIIKESTDSVLQGQQYQQAKVDAWVTGCQELCMKRLVGLHQPFKYIITTIIVQKTGAGLHTAASCFWDHNSDGSKTLRWENKSMYAISSVFGLAL